MRETRSSGVRTGDRGIGKHGERKPGFEPGVDIRAKVTILADGVRGNLTKAVVRRLALDAGRQPQLYALGIKELWDVPADRVAPGTVIHTLGYPLRMEEFGGGFIYSMPEGRLAVGFVTGLDYQDPMFDPHVRVPAFQAASIRRGAVGRRSDGAVRREGAARRRVAHHPARLCRWAVDRRRRGRLPELDPPQGHSPGDAHRHAGGGDGLRCRHAAATRSAARLRGYEAAIDSSEVRRELYPVRNVHQSFGYGLAGGHGVLGFVAAVGRMVGARSDAGACRATNGCRRSPPTTATAVPIRTPVQNPAKIDRQLTFDRLTNVHFSGTRHAEDQPSHLIVHDADICRTRCREEYGNPCTRFCPANVYEMVDAGDGTKRLQINASNCVHCKTCDIMDPYQIIDWVPPEGGGGPDYEGM